MQHKSILLLILIILIHCGLVIAQSTRLKITGMVVENEGNQPLEFATVKLLDQNTNNLITGTSTDLDGRFTLETNSSSFYLEVGFIGFETLLITEFDFQNGLADLGNVSLSSDAQTLDEVTVRAEKSVTEFKLDKRVFNVGKDLSSTGASALEVLNNVPSVNVNIEGEISLRGSSGVQILINGKPSVLANEQGNALGTITADMIEKIEVITNPSAKYDAEGTSGIINIVIKKEERKGLNGSVTVNTGTPHNHSLGLSLNRRTEKFNMFSQLGVGYRELPNDRESINSGKTSVASIGEEFRNETFYNLILGTDYIIDKNNILTLSGYAALEIEDQPSFTDFTAFDEFNQATSVWTREEETEATNPKFQYEFQYKRDFKDSKDHTLLFSALGNFFGKDQSSDFINQTLSGENRDLEQKTSTNFGEAIYTFKLDYTKPFSKKVTMETGAQYVINDVNNDFEVNDIIDGVIINNPDQTNTFEWNQKVLGAYTTLAYEGDIWGIKLGLRVENTDLNTLLVNNNQDNDQNYTDLFPTLHTSYKMTENFSLQAGYSRRIFRPRLWDLNPFFNIRNDFNIRTGNPDLLPEYTDSYEIAGIYIIGELSLNFGIYHRYTTDVVNRISTFENNIRTTQPFNIGTDQSTGLEFNGKYSPKKWWTLNGDINFNYFNRQGALEGVSFDFDADQWTAKLTNKFNLPGDFDFEFTGQYQSAFQTVQGTNSETAFLDLGLRKTLMQGRTVLNLSIRDLFASRIQESFTFQDGFSGYSFRQRGRFVTFGISYGFGKGEAMEFSGQKRRGGFGGGRRR